MIKSDVVIIGGGLIGLCLSYFLGKLALSVSIIDKDIVIEALKISIRNLSKNDIIKRELPKNLTGVVVTKISENSPLKFVSVNDVIVELQKKKIMDSNHFSKLVDDILNKNQKTLLFAIYNLNNQRSYLTVKLQ